MGAIAGAEGNPPKIETVTSQQRGSVKPKLRAFRPVVRLVNISRQAATTRFCLAMQYAKSKQAADETNTVSVSRDRERNPARFVFRSTKLQLEHFNEFAPRVFCLYDELLQRRR